jgi:LmbE family N-acetylglucosaminyl deacetylase
MNGPGARARARSALGKLMKNRLVVRGEEALRRPAVVFAPHPDDETLGCGGTIIKKTAAGANVRIVVMTDGRGSHRKLIDEDRLKAIRAGEALEAAARMGTDRSGVHLLEYRDKELDTHFDEAVRRVTSILEDDPPAEIYVPYLYDSTPDHVSTRRVALTAASVLPRGATVLEYPVWFWHHWPWVPYPLSSRRRLPRVVMENVSAVARLLRHFNACVSVADVLEDKRRALDAYASQMTRLTGDPAWTRLEDVAGGEFLQCFFQEYEVFWERPAPGV